MTIDEGIKSWQRQLRIVAGIVILCCGLAVALVAAPGLGRGWGGDTPQGASLARVGSDVAEPPQPLTGGEAYVTTRVLPSGDLDVTQWIESDQLLFAVQIAAQEAAGTAGMAAEDVRVVADGRAISGPDRVAGVAQRYAFLGASSVQIRYVLTGATERSTSAPGRALVRATALDVSYEPASERVVKTVVAPEVLALACTSPAATGSPTPCGTRSSDGEWTVELEGARVADQVTAQLTLE